MSEKALKADTLEELAKLMEVPEAQFVATIERWNEMVAAGKDEDFGKIASRLFPVETAPFYATPCRQGDMLVCIGGLVSDEECHVFDEEKRVIPGFYVAGNVQGNRFAVQYPIAFKGVSIRWRYTTATWPARTPSPELGAAKPHTLPSIRRPNLL